MATAGALDAQLKQILRVTIAERQIERAINNLSLSPY